MNRKLSLMFLAVVLIATACAPSADVEQERATLRERDQAWSETPPDVDRLMSFFDTDASFLPPNMPIATGTPAIRQVLERLMTLPGFALHWTAVKADVGRAGDLGYTQGTYELTLDDPAGNSVTERGKYVTVWKKNAENQWMVVADIFNADQAPPMPPAPSEPS